MFCETSGLEKPTLETASTVRRAGPGCRCNALLDAVRKGGPNDQSGRLFGRTKSGMNTNLHAGTDGDGRPIRFFMTAGEISAYTCSAALLDSLPTAEWLLVV